MEIAPLKNSCSLENLILWFHQGGLPHSSLLAPFRWSFPPPEILQIPVNVSCVGWTDLPTLYNVTHPTLELLRFPQ